MSGTVDQDTPHRLGGRGEEMSAILPGGLGVTAQPEAGFVHERRGLQRLAGRFVRHFVRGESAQFFVNEREQFVRSLGVTVLDAVQDARDIAHAVDARRRSAKLHA